MVRAKKTEEVIQETPVEDTPLPEYDLRALYQEHFRQQQEFFEDQQKKVLEYWTGVLNNCWWWKK